MALTQRGPNPLPLQLSLRGKVYAWVIHVKYMFFFFFLISMCDIYVAYMGSGWCPWREHNGRISRGNFLAIKLRKKRVLWSPCVWKAELTATRTCSFLDFTDGMGSPCGQLWQGCFDNIFFLFVLAYQK